MFTMIKRVFFLVLLFFILSVMAEFEKSKYPETRPRDDERKWSEVSKKWVKDCVVGISHRLVGGEEIERLPPESHTTVKSLDKDAILERVQELEEDKRMLEMKRDLALVRAQAGGQEDREGMKKIQRYYDMKIAVIEDEIQRLRSLL